MATCTHVYNYSIIDLYYLEHQKIKITDNISEGNDKYTFRFNIVSYEEQKVILKIKEECDAEMAVAEPTLRKAKEALQNLNEDWNAIDEYMHKMIKETKDNELKMN